MNSDEEIKYETEKKFEDNAFRSKSLDSESCGKD
jgi:hypothetical protein